MSYQEQDARAFGAFRHAIGRGMFRRANCPFCPTEVGKADKRMSLSFNLKSRWYQCWRCDTKGKLREIPEHILANIEEPEREIKFIEQPEDTHPVTGDALSLRPARKYLRSRRLSQKVWGGADIHACLGGYYNRRIIVPIRLEPGKPWVGFVGRDWTNRSRLRYIYPRGMVRGKFVFNQSALFRETDEPVLVVEGVFDALPYWPNAVACLGKPSEEQRQLMLQAKRPIVVALDGDAWEQGWHLALWLQLNDKRAASVKLPPTSDPNDIDRRWLVTEARRAIQ